ncbi:DNA cytosine methyltransferase [Kitasatospora sp. NPDC089797]|uniref:DNA cytosine methyltransferase n=1 Tax=Kitasatospora sp. NPDC089797 TaxID=3155298 RepID=UPI003417EF83
MTGPVIGSLCSGYGGLDMAVQSVLGGELAWVADPDPGAAAILAHHHPHTPNLGDITAVNWAEVRPVDVLTAGFPCQSVSLAGKGAGIVPGATTGGGSGVAA